MRFFRVIFPLTLITLAISLHARAQSSPPIFEVFAEGGGSFLNGGKGTIPGPATTLACNGAKFFCPGAIASSSFSSAGRIAAGARVRLTPRNAVEASYSLSFNNFSIQQGGVLTSRPIYNRVDLVSFNYVRYLSVGTSIQPFISGGLGLNRFRFAGSPPACAAIYPSPCQPFGSNTNNGFQFAANFGGGVDVVLQRHVALRFEIRDYVTGQPAFIKGASHDITPSVGIVFRFK
ncbi:MAG: hypothetical protein ACRD11_04565 [Terriglobia bacterium]